MFTGIIECMGEITAIRTEGSNRIFDVKAPFPDPIQVDQSIAHEGVCLTVTEIYEQSEAGAHYSVTAVDETLRKTHLETKAVGDQLNIERCMKVGARLDGHFVQGHVDTTGKVRNIQTLEGSWMIEFSFPSEYQHLLVDKGSICINGVSLTVVESHKNWFSVTIIPYTWEHTSFQFFDVGTTINLEFDILGKYIAKIAGNASIK